MAGMTDFSLATSAARGREQEVRSSFQDFFLILIFLTSLITSLIVNPVGAGGRRQPGRISCPLYFSHNISATRKRRNAELCIQLPEYLTEVVCKSGANLISDDVRSQIINCVLHIGKRCSFVMSL